MGSRVGGAFLYCSGFGHCTLSELAAIYNFTFLCIGFGGLPLTVSSVDKWVLLVGGLFICVSVTIYCYISFN
jgi:hypothetical protein